jgi:ABC-type multidrug transport system permease subunit
MNYRLHATRVIAKRRIFETLITPGYYVAVAIGLLLAYLLLSAFTRSVDSSGFDYHLQPLYDLFGRTVEGAFGAVVVEKLFAEGPFQLVLYVAFLPVILFLAASSVYRFGLERRVGAVELLAYGPADGTSYFLASLIKDVALTLLYLVVLLAFAAVCAVLFNLVLGPTFFVSLAVLFFVSVTVYAYGILASTLTDNSASALAVFLALMVFFLAVFLGSFSIVSGYVRNLAGVFAWILKWISPVFYWDQALRATEVGGWPLFLVDLAALLLLSGAVLAASHYILRARGVRP